MIRRGLTLVELLVTITISMVLIGAVIFTFNNINIGVRNAERSNDLTTVMRNASSMFQADLAEAGRGLGDLGTLQIHFLNDQADADEPYFYGIVGQDDLNGFSQIVFQWFDYDPINEPTYVVMNPGSAPGGTWVSPITSMDFHLADPGDPALTDISTGDIFVVYDPAIMFSRDLHQILYTNIQPDFSYDEAVLGNGAMLLQVNGAQPFPGDGRVVVSFGSDDVFKHTLTPPVNQYTNTESDYTLLVTRALTDGKDEFQFKPPTGVWLARRLGQAASYRRVRYFVNATNALIRRDESFGEPQDMVLATNVTEFQIQIGTDISNPLDPAQQDPAVWDNSVRSDQMDHWFSSASTLEDKILIGRHAVSARIRLSVKALIEDVMDLNAAEGRTDAAFKQRTIEKQFKIRNQHRPQVNY